jgi:hypothetical protein
MGKGSGISDYALSDYGDRENFFGLIEKRLAVRNQTDVSGYCGSPPVQVSLVLHRRLIEIYIFKVEDRAVPADLTDALFRVYSAAVTYPETAGHSHLQ